MIYIPRDVRDAVGHLAVDANRSTSPVYVEAALALLKTRGRQVVGDPRPRQLLPHRQLRGSRLRSGVSMSGSSNPSTQSTIFGEAARAAAPGPPGRSCPRR